MSCATPNQEQASEDETEIQQNHQEDTLRDDAVKLCRGNVSKNNVTMDAVHVEEYVDMDEEVTIPELDKNQESWQKDQESFVKERKSVGEEESSEVLLMMDHLKTWIQSYDSCKDKIPDILDNYRVSDPRMYSTLCSALGVNGFLNSNHNFITSTNHHLVNNNFNYSIDTANLSPASDNIVNYPYRHPLNTGSFADCANFNHPYNHVPNMDTFPVHDGNLGCSFYPPPSINPYPVYPIPLDNNYSSSYPLPSSGQYPLADDFNYSLASSVHYPFENCGTYPLPSNVPVAFDNSLNYPPPWNVPSPLDNMNCPYASTSMYPGNNFVHIPQESNIFTSGCTQEHITAGIFQIPPGTLASNSNDAEIANPPINDISNSIEASCKSSLGSSGDGNYNNPEAKTVSFRNWSTLNPDATPFTITNPLVNDNSKGKQSTSNILQYNMLPHVKKEDKGYKNKIFKCGRPATDFMINLVKNRNLQLNCHGGILFVNRILMQQQSRMLQSKISDSTAQLYLDVDFKDLAEVIRFLESGKIAIPIQRLPTLMRTGDMLQIDLFTSTIRAATNNGRSIGLNLCFFCNRDLEKGIRRSIQACTHDHGQKCFQLRNQQGPSVYPE